MASTLQFKTATKEQSKLRMAIDGPSGSGKTYTALTFAFALAGPHGKVAGIDTESGRMRKYADKFPHFDVLELDTYSPSVYTDAIMLAETCGYDVLVIDSLSHAWDGVGGALEMVDKAGGGANKFAAWKTVTPIHKRMLETILRSKMHIIVTMRSKIETVMEQDERGKTSVRKVGLAPVQRKDIEYEFDVYGSMDMAHTLTVTKDITGAVDGAAENKPTGSWMQPIIAWLNAGERPATTQAPTTTTEQRDLAPTATPKATGIYKTEAKPAHWIDEPGTREKFWAWSKSTLALSEQEVYAALGVKHVHDYKGSKTDAMNTLDVYAKAKAEAAKAGAQ